MGSVDAGDVALMLLSEVSKDHLGFDATLARSRMISWLEAHRLLPTMNNGAAVDGSRRHGLMNPSHGHGRPPMWGTCDLRGSNPPPITFPHRGAAALTGSLSHCGRR